MKNFLKLFNFFVHINVCLSSCAGYKAIISQDNIWCKSTPNCIYVNQDPNKVIQSVLNKIRDNKGGTLLIKSGTYVISSQLTFYGKTTIQGEGVDRTILKVKDNSPSWKYAGFLRATFKSGKCDNIIIRSLTLDGNKKNQRQSSYGRFGLFTEVCHNVVFDKVKIVNFQGYGFDPHGHKPNKVAESKYFARNLTITNCIAENNDWDGFTIDQTDGAILRSNLATNNGRHGFNVVTGSRNVLIERCKTNNNGYYYFEKTKGCGVTIQNNLNFGTRNVVLKNNVLTNDAKASICLRNVKHITITENQLNHGAKQCVTNKGSLRVKLDNNVCS